MLPRLEEKDQCRDNGTYRAFTREILKRKSSDNNIANLKMLKEFLDQEPPADPPKKEKDPLSIPRIFVENREPKAKPLIGKENSTSPHHYRKASTAETTKNLKKENAEPRP